jgi:hypothetical protein
VRNKTIHAATSTRISDNSENISNRSVVVFAIAVKQLKLMAIFTLRGCGELYTDCPEVD